MKAHRWRLALFAVVVLLTVGGGVATRQLPALGAGGLLHPARYRVVVGAPETCDDASFSGARVVLEGWRCHASGHRRGMLVYLHGVADNRTSAAGVVQRFGPRGFDVVAYDSRAHGESD